MKDEKYSPKRIASIVDSTQTIIALANSISLEWHSELVDTKFNNPAINQKTKRIISDTQDILKHCFTIVNPKREMDYIQYEHATEVLRVLKFFSNMSTEQLREYMDLVEKMPIENIDDLIEMF